jgi:hypothetical protein
MANDEVQRTANESKDISLAKILDHGEIDLEQLDLKKRTENWDMVEDPAEKEVEEGFCVECEGQFPLSRYQNGFDCLGVH